MSTYKTYQTSKKLEEEGVWLTTADGTRWRIARATSKRAQTALREARRPYITMFRQAELNGTEVDEKIVDKVNMEYTLNGLLLEWEDGPTDENDEVILFAKTNFPKIGKLLSDLPDLHVEILQASGRAASYKEMMQDEASKNSVPVSVTSLSTERS